MMRPPPGFTPWQYCAKSPWQACRSAAVCAKAALDNAKVPRMIANPRTVPSLELRRNTCPLNPTDVNLAGQTEH
jgi:hypothetical protein